jgi:hypothetical protein
MRVFLGNFYLRPSTTVLPKKPGHQRASRCFFGFPFVFSAASLRTAIYALFTCQRPVLEQMLMDLFRLAGAPPGSVEHMYPIGPVFMFGVLSSEGKDSLFAPLNCFHGQKSSRITRSICYLPHTEQMPKPLFALGTGP